MVLVLPSVSLLDTKLTQLCSWMPARGLAWNSLLKENHSRDICELKYLFLTNRERAKIGVTTSWKTL